MLAPVLDCPSCHGTGVATVPLGNGHLMRGDCRCVGGVTWAVTIHPRNPYYQPPPPRTS